MHAWARLLGLLTLLGWIGAFAIVTTLFVHRTKAALVSSLLSAEGGDGAEVGEASDVEKALYYLRFDMAACSVGVAGSLALSMMLWCVPRPYGVGFYKKYEGGGGKDGWAEDGGANVSAARSKRSSSTTDAGSVMSGETAVSASAGAGAGAGDGDGDAAGGDKDLKLKDDGGEKPGLERAQRHVPGHFPQGEA